MESSSEIRIPWGDRNGTLVHISKIPKERRGLKCECVCPKCGTSLVARLGEKQRPNFAHHSPGGKSPACGVEIDGLLHKVASRIVAGAAEFPVPAVTCGPIFELEDKDAKHVLRKGEVLRIRKAEEEVYVHGIKPDVLFETEDGRKVAIEIYVTHAVEDKKRKTLREHGLATLEIDLSSDRGLAWDEDELRRTLLEGLAPAKWTFHPAAEQARKEIVKASFPLLSAGEEGGALAPDGCEASENGVAKDCLKCRYCGTSSGELEMRCFVRSGATTLAEIREFARTGRKAPTPRDKFPPKRNPAPVRSAKSGFPPYRPASLPSRAPRKSSMLPPRLPIEVRGERIAKLRKLLPEWADKIDYSNPDSSENFEWIPWKDRNFCMHCQRLAAGVPDPEGGTRYYCVNEGCHLGGCCVYRK